MNEQQTDMEAGHVQAQDPSFHEIRIYNDVRDKLWMHLDLALSAENMDNLQREALSLRLLLLRADGIWAEIKKAVDGEKKRKKLTVPFPYESEFSTKAQEVIDKLTFMARADALAWDGDEEAELFLQMPIGDRVMWLKHNIEKIIIDADKVWGEKAASLNFTMPINVKESRDPFL